MNNLAVRHREPELMDDPNLAPALHQQALAGLQRVHRVTGTVRTLWHPIRRLAARSPNAAIRVLDVACGGGDITVALARKARRAGLSMDVAGCDISQTALDFATSNALAQHVDVRYFQMDVVSAPLPNDYDVVCCSLFLHHLDEADAVELLRSMRLAARRMVLISDLVRSKLGLALTWSGLRLLTRSRICHVDGPLSVRAAYTPEEIRDIAARAELRDAGLTRHWPQRFLLTWSRS